MKPAKKKHGEELLEDLGGKIKAALVSLAELNPDLSEHVGNEIVNQMSEHWGGQIIYFPQGMMQKISTRDLQIWEEFSGSNHAELARKYHISLQWVYRIVKTMRKQQTQKRQGQLFNSEG